MTGEEAVRWPSAAQESKVKKFSRVQNSKGALSHAFPWLQKEGVEAMEDGRRVVFFCQPCGAWCHSEGSLEDHLKGRKHRSRLISLGLKKGEGTSETLGKMTIPSDAVTPKGNPTPVQKVTLEPPVEGHKQISFPHNSTGAIAVSGNPDGRSEGRKEKRKRKKREDGDFPLALVPKKVDAQQIEGHSKVIPSLKLIESVGDEKDSLRFALVLFKYDKLVGRGEPQSVEESEPKALPQGKEKNKGGKKGRRGKAMAERSCFLCRRQMRPGVEVASLLSLDSGQMACSSRNRQEKFHVFHSACLRDWTIFCHSHASHNDWFSAMKEGSEGVEIEGKELGLLDHQPSEDNWANEGIPRDSEPSLEPPVATISGPFCPECQGTGLRVGPHEDLERPRFRLAQVYQWMLELAQARRTWSSSKAKSTTLVAPLTVNASDLSLGEQSTASCTEKTKASSKDQQTMP